MFKKIYLAALVVFSIALLPACSSKKAPLGSLKNPVKIFFVPSVDAKMLADTSRLLKKYLEENTPYRYQISVPQSFIAVVEAFGTRRADIAAINTYGYVLAHNKYQAEARLTVIRHGSSTYRSQFVVRSDSDIKSISDLKNRKIAFVDPASMSGYLLPLSLLKEKDIKFKDSVFAMKHDNAVAMVYNKQVDAAAGFYSPPSDLGDGKKQIEDARRLVLTQYPDVVEKVKILDLTGEIPNDPIIFRKDIPPEMKATIEAALLKFIATSEGKEAFSKMYGATGLVPSTDADYLKVRNMLVELGIDVQKILRK